LTVSSIPYNFLTCPETIATFIEGQFSVIPFSCSNSANRQEPKYPPYLTGLLLHHGDCTRFVQCAHGATYMSCSIGTVFNLTIGVCDWPRNVKGCEGNNKGLFSLRPCLYKEHFLGSYEAAWIQIRLAPAQIPLNLNTTKRLHLHIQLWSPTSPNTWKSKKSHVLRTLLDYWLIRRHVRSSCSVQTVLLTAWIVVPELLLILLCWFAIGHTMYLAVKQVNVGSHRCSTINYRHCPKLYDSCRIESN